MDSILQAASPVNAEPIWHPDVPCRAVGVGDLVQNTEVPHPCGIVHARGGDETEH